MRVLMLNYEFPPLGGGAANANYYLLKEYAKMPGVHVDLITSSSGRRSVERFSDNINIYKLDVGKKSVHYWRAKEIFVWSIKAFFLSRKLMSKKKYDICHSWFGWPCGVIGYVGGLPYIVALRGSDVPGYSSRLKWLDKIVFKPLSRIVWKNAVAVTANSDGLKSLALATLKRDIDVIYNGVDTEEFRPEPKRAGRRLKIVSVGRLIERKGFGYLIKAIAGLDVDLTIIGEGPLEKELKDLAKMQGAKVVFTGCLPHGEIASELRKADVFTLPSLNEGMSNTVLEAMACGLPVIVSDVGGSVELVLGNGKVVARGDASGIRDALDEYLKKPALLRQHGHESRRIAERMSWKKMAERYVLLYGRHE